MAAAAPAAGAAPAFPMEEDEEEEEEEDDVVVVEIEPNEIKIIGNSLCLSSKVAIAHALKEVLLYENRGKNAMMTVADKAIHQNHEDVGSIVYDWFKDAFVELRAQEPDADAEEETKTMQFTFPLIF